MKHLSDEELVLRYYGEEPDWTRAGEHLRECADCQWRLRDLSGVLDAVEVEPAPDPGEGYGAEVWERIRWRLEGPRSRWQEWFSWKPIAAVAAIVAVLGAVAFLAGRRLGPAGPAPLAGIPEEARQRILMTAVTSHLDRSQQVLVEFLNTPHDGAVDLSAFREIASALLTENRLYRLSALREGNTALASVLEDLEGTLLEIRHSQLTMSRHEWEVFQDTVDVAGTLFKMRVFGAQARDRGPATERTVL